MSPPYDLGPHPVLRPRSVDYVDTATKHRTEVHFEWHQGPERSEHAAFQHAVRVRLFGP